MSRNWWLLFVTMILGIWNEGIVWFTQIAVYPLWPLVGREQFHTAFFWAPVQAAMATNDGMSAALYHELMATHCFRVLFFLVYAGLMVWLVVRSLPNRRAQKAPGFANETA